MTFLKNKTAWKKWAKEFNRSQPSCLCDPPKYFPCFVYTVVHSFGYEEEKEIYLHRDEVAQMLRQLQQP